MSALTDLRPAPVSGHIFRKHRKSGERWMAKWRDAGGRHQDATKSHPTVHHPECDTLSEDSFATKVIENNRRNGRYSAATNTTIAEDRGAVKCGACYR